MRVAIIGSGFGGLAAAIRLKQSGRDDFLVLERADEVGGTWRDNTYPGCACDVESHLYSLSFAPNPDWSRTFSPQPEIQAYLVRCADEFGVRPHLRPGHEVRAADWDERAQRWRVETSAGSLTADVLVMASGPLSDPYVPDLPGIGSFRGAAFHSSRWDHGVALEGKRVAVVGTGASAVQFVPAIQPRVARLHLFQRTASWVMPRRQRELSRAERRLFRRFPALRRAVRGALYLFHEIFVVNFRNPRGMALAEAVARRHLRRQVPDAALRAKLTPDFRLGCKRVLLSNDYLPALTRENVEVVTDSIAEVRPHAIVTADGVERPVDVIVFGTGFRPTDPPLAPHVRGRGGRSLADVWEGSPRAHLGTTVAGFPNFFVLLGPNTGLGHSSVVYMMEAQVEHLLAALDHMDRHGVGAMEPRPEAQEAFVAAVEERMRGTVWVSGGCRSWYIDETGRNSTIWPDHTWRFRRRVAGLRPEEYATEPRRAEAAG